jgi:hypothetical protein
MLKMTRAADIPGDVKHYSGQLLRGFARIEMWIS